MEKLTEQLRAARRAYNELVDEYYAHALAAGSVGQNYTKKQREEINAAWEKVKTLEKMLKREHSEKLNAAKKNKKPPRQTRKAASIKKKHVPGMVTCSVEWCSAAIPWQGKEMTLETMRATGWAVVVGKDHSMRALCPAHARQRNIRKGEIRIV